MGLERVTGASIAAASGKEPRPSQRFRGGDRGASLLLEAVVGLALFSVSLLLLFGIFPTAQRSVTQAKNVALAHNLAREFLERERALPYDDVGNVTPAATAPPEILALPTTVNGVAVNTQYEATVVVSEPEADKRKVITVFVAWTEGPVARQVVLETCKVKYPAFIGGP